MFWRFLEDFIGVTGVLRESQRIPQAFSGVLEGCRSVIASLRESGSEGFWSFRELYRIFSGLQRRHW